jgi:hypothetical protein
MNTTNGSVSSIDENGNEKIDEEVCDFNEFNIIE